MATRNVVDTSFSGQTGTGKFVGDTAPTMTNVTINDININTDTISTITTNGNLYLEPNGTGHVDVGDPGLEVGNILIDGIAFNSRFRVNDIGNTAPAMVTIHKHSTTQEPLQIAARSNSNTSAHATVTANMPLYSMYATGWLNSYYGIFGQIRFSADSTGTLADGSAPGKLELMVTPNGAVIPVTALSISNAGVTTLANALPVASGGTGVGNSNWTASSLTFSPTTQGIVGTTTNDSAGAGYVGEEINSDGTVAVSSNVYTNITSISLTAGDWDVYGNMLYASTANATTQFAGWISITSASYPGNSLASDLSFSSGTIMTSGQAFTVPYRRYNLSSTTTIYLTGVAVFSSGTGSIEGRINARRAR